MKNRFSLPIIIVIGGIVSAYAACYTWGPSACRCNIGRSVCILCPDGVHESCIGSTSGPFMDCAWEAPKPDATVHNFNPRDCVFQTTWSDCNGNSGSAPTTNSYTPTYSGYNDCPGG